MGRSHHTPPNFYAVFEQVQASQRTAECARDPGGWEKWISRLTGNLVLFGWSVGTKYLRNGGGPPQKGESLAGLSGHVANQPLPGPRHALKFSTSRPLARSTLTLTPPTSDLNHCIPALFGALVRPRGVRRSRTSGPASACRARKGAGWGRRRFSQPAQSCSETRLYFM